MGVDRPVRIYRASWPMRMMGVGYIVLGLVCLVVSWFPLSDRPSRIPGFVGLIWMVAGLTMTRADAELVCEISERGIRAPEGFCRRSTFVPWEEVARCEIIPDDGNDWCGHFVLEDRSGRRRFAGFSSRLLWLTTSERARILHALGSRFPRKAKAEHDPGRTPARRASFALWDREIDG